MDLQDRIISKDEINDRAVEALLAIINNGLVATKADLAECLGAKPSKFSEILNYRMKVGVDIIAKICDRYYVNPDWLLMGRGNKVFRNDTNREPYFIEDENNLDRNWHNEEEKTDTNNASAPKEYEGMAEVFYNKTLEQAEYIGQLKAKIKELEQKLQKTADAASTEITANAG